jgi:toxin ParE1/3/4
MATGGAFWSVALGSAAEHDFEEILRWTADTFGHAQAQRYQNALVDLIDALHEGPDRAGVKQRYEIAPGMRTLYLRAIKHRGAHLVLFQTVGSEIFVLRILHDSMDLAAQAFRTKDER